MLDGVFQDEAGDYPAGSWLRHPRWSRHTPRSGPQGALIYVKVGAIDAPFMPLPRLIRSLRLDSRRPDQFMAAREFKLP